MDYGAEVGTIADHNRYRPSSTDGTLTITNVQLGDEKWYWCEGRNEADNVFGKAFFEVQSKKICPSDN